MMPDDPPEPGSYPVPANDNRNTNEPDPAALRKLDAVALRLARIIGRRMAREDFDKAVRAANDNAPPAGNRSEQDADDEH